MSTKLAERFQANQGAPIEWHGHLIHMMYEVTAPEGSPALQIQFTHTNTQRPQALRLKLRGGNIEINQQRLDDVVLWAEDVPGPVVGQLLPKKPGNPVALRTWNAWRDHTGAMQAWIGNSGIIIEVPAKGATTLKCSDGFGEPSFDDLIVQLSFRPSPD